MSVEFYKGNQRLAPYCTRFSKGTAVPREREQLSLFSPPFIKPVRLLTADELFYKSRAAARSGRAREPRRPPARARLHRARSLISRREEWMASECLFTGKVKCLDGDTQEIVAELTYGTPSEDGSREAVERSRERPARRSARRAASRLDSAARAPI